MKEMFENLMQVDHPNIVKFHKYWLDIGDNHARVTNTHTAGITMVSYCSGGVKYLVSLNGKVHFSSILNNLFGISHYFCSAVAQKIHTSLLWIIRLVCNLKDHIK